MKLPPLSCVIFKCTPEAAKEEKKATAKTVKATAKKAAAKTTAKAEKKPAAKTTAQAEKKPAKKAAKK